MSTETCHYTWISQVRSQDVQTARTGVLSHLEMVSSQCIDFPMNLGIFNAYNTQPLKFMFPNSSSNQFNIPTSQQYNNHMPFPTLFPWSIWNKGTCPLKTVQDTWSIFSNHTHSFPLPTIICYFLHSSPRAHGLKAQEFLEAVQVHGQYSQNNSSG